MSFGCLLGQRRILVKHTRKEQTKMFLSDFSWFYFKRFRTHKKKKETTTTKTISNEHEKMYVMIQY